jgi:hypothetical protein
MLAFCRPWSVEDIGATFVAKDGGAYGARERAAKLLTKMRRAGSRPTWRS